MSKKFYRLFIAGLVLAVGTASLAQDPGKKTAAHDHKLRASINRVINTGAELYNSGNQEGAYQLFRGALMAVGPALEHHSALAKTIEDGLKTAATQGAVAERAFYLRGVLGEVLKSLPKAPGTEVAKPRTTETPTPKPTPKPKTLYEQLGGKKGVDEIVSDFLNRAEKDPRVNFTRKGTPEEWNPTPENKDKLKKHMIEFVSTYTGGPKTYTGPDMKQAHKGMKITAPEYEASVQDLRKSLDKFNVPAAARDKLLGMVEGMRSQIVAKPTEKPKETKETTKPKDTARPKETTKPKEAPKDTAKPKDK